MENYLENVAVNSEETVQQNEQNIAISTQEVMQSEFQGAAAESVKDLTTASQKYKFAVYYNDDFNVKPSISQISLTVPKSLFKKLNITTRKQSQRISFAVYRKPLFFQSQVKGAVDRETVNKLNSWVISGSIKGQRLDDLQDSIVTTYRPLQDGINEKTACVFWDFSLKDGIGDWSQAGCMYEGTKDGIVTCRCSHLTNFAILMVSRTRHEHWLLRVCCLDL